MKTIFNIFKWGNARSILMSIVLIGITVETTYFLTSPEIALLPPHFNGEWIRPNKPTSIQTHPDPITKAIFRKRFFVSTKTQDAYVDIGVFRDLRDATLDGEQLTFSTPSNWKDRIHIVIPSRLLSPGLHEMKLTVLNRMAPPLMHLTSNLPGLGDTNGWDEATIEGAQWRQALGAGEQRDPALKKIFPTVLEGMRTSLPFFLPIFIGTFILTSFKPGFSARIGAPETVRLLLFGFLLFLGVNNMLKIGANITDMGFDGKQHIEYISYLFENHHLPLASEGWQMFQPPLYYAVSAALLLLLQPFVPIQHAHFILSIVPLCCLLLLVEISYRLLRELFPKREDLQSCGLFVGGLLPMNLYICQFVGNEPLTAVLTAFLLLLTVKFLFSRTIRMKDMMFLGVIAGFAIITKVTPLMLLPMVFGLILIVPEKERVRISSRVKAAGLFILTTFIVAGWFFVRNWVELGKPLYGGWDVSRKIVWWQEPGYRIVSDYFSFGEALRQPVYACFEGFADALYSTFWSDGYNIIRESLYTPELPHWNYIPLAAGVAFSCVPALSILIGIGIAFWHTGKKEWWPFTFLFVSLEVYFAALIHLFTTVPIFSTVKASYSMGLTPCFAAMASLGAGLFIQNKYMRPLFISSLVTWGVMTYAGFFIF